MAELGVHWILLLVISLTKCLEGTKLLTELKKCGDLECEILMSRVVAMRDYTGPDCLYLNFTKGEEISVYVKLAGEREDLWAGSKGKDFGFFPRDAVQIEEEFISEEVEISTKESDFLCLLGVSYIFENEDSEFNSHSGENMYPYEEEQKYSIDENDSQIESIFYAISESTLIEGQFPASEAPEDIRSNWEEAKPGSVEQDRIPEVDHVSPPLTVPEVQGWFGLEKEHGEEKAHESVTEPVQQSSFQSRKITVEDENNLEELTNGEPQTEPESEFDSVPEEQSELALESKQVRTTQATGWFGGGFTSYLGFGEEDTGLELQSKESNPPLQDVPNFISSDEKAIVPCTEILTEKEDTITNDSTVLKPNWLDFGFGMLGFAYASEDNIVLDDGTTEKDGEVDKQEHPLASKFDHDNEQEIKMIKTLETEDQTDKESVLEKTDDYDTIPYLKKLLYNFDNPWSFQNIPKEAELSSPKQTLDQSNMDENDEREEFSGENDPTDNMKDLMMLKNRYSQSDMISQIPIIHKEVLFETSFSKNDEKSKPSVDFEEPAQVEIDRSVENTLLNSQAVSTDNSLSSQNYIPPNEDATEFQILQYLLQIDVYEFLNSAFSLVVILTEKADVAKEREREREREKRREEKRREEKRREEKRKKFEF